MPLEDAAEVLLLADRYGISRLQRQAEHAIGRRITPETAAGALHLARAVNATDLERFVTLWAEGQADSAVVLKTLGLLPQPTDAERSRERGRDAEALADAAFLSTPWLISRPPPTCSVQQQGSATVADDTIDGNDVAAAGQDQPAAQDEFVIHPSAGGAHRWSVRGGDNPPSASPQLSFQYHPNQVRVCPISHRVSHSLQVAAGVACFGAVGHNPAKRGDRRGCWCRLAPVQRRRYAPDLSLAPATWAHPTVRPGMSENCSHRNHRVVRGGRTMSRPHPG